MSSIIPLQGLGFIGILQIVLLILFVVAGLALLFFQNSLGTPFVETVLGLFAGLAITVGYAAYSFAMSVGKEALAVATSAQSEIILQGVSEEAMGHLKIAGFNVAVLALFALIAGLRAYLIKRSRLF